MKGILDVNGLCKNYPKFRLDNVSFELEKGKITGFIGRNGAGKTTTLKSLLNFVHPDAGEIKFFGSDFAGNEDKIKSRIGFVSGGIDYYPTKKIKTITQVTKRFYPEWDDATYRNYLNMFELDEEKTPQQLSAGMKVKYALALALSHNAELLMLDEPTSGLDPVSRDDLLDVFMRLSESGVTIFFSTHITTDLDKCADNIIYIKKGVIAADDTLDGFVSGYRTVAFESEPEPDAKLIGLKRVKHGYEALVKAGDAGAYGAAEKTDLETIMVHCEEDGNK